MKPGYGCDEKDLAHYTCFRTNDRIDIDGRLDTPGWQKAPKSGRFVDLVSGTPGFLDTRMAALWDDDNLYVAFWLEEPNVRARLTERDVLSGPRTTLRSSSAGRIVTTNSRSTRWARFTRSFTSGRTLIRRGAASTPPNLI